MSTKKSPVLKPGIYVRSFTNRGKRRHIFITLGETGSTGEVLNNSKFKELPFQSAIIRLQAKDAGPNEKKTIQHIIDDGMSRWTVSHSSESIRSGETRGITREKAFEVIANLPTFKEVLGKEG